MSIILTIISIISQATYFETRYGTQNPIAKSTSKPEQCLIIVKVITVVAFVLVGKANNSTVQWLVILLLLFLSVFLAFKFYQFQPYYYIIISKLFDCLCFGFLWGCGILFIGKVFEKTSFNGLLGLFFIGFPIVMMIMFTRKEDISDMYSFGKYSKGERALSQIQYLIYLIDNKDYNRKAKVMLTGYIEHFEETCGIKDCPLKKYINSYKNSKIDAFGFLLQHCEICFQRAISKYPMCYTIRIAYAFFLIERMNKRQQASAELTNIENNSPGFEEQFIIYRYKRLLEEQTNDINENDDNLDIISTIEYKNQFQKFKNSIVKVTGLYLEFWSLLLNPNEDCQENLTKLSDYGTKINIMVEEINNQFERIQKLKQNDQETIRYYSDFLNDILNDKEKAEKLKNKLTDNEENKPIPEEANIMNLLDINSINSNSDFQFIVVSAQPDKFGIISNLSLGACLLLGYTKMELLGKSLEVIMPEIYHKEHRELLLDKVNEFKKTSFELFDLKTFKPLFKDVVTFARNKSRYLVPVSFKVTLLPTDNSDLFFVGKIWQDSRTFNNTESIICYLITNNFLTIQNFTPNAVSILGVTSNAMNSTIEITEFIKQLQEEYIKIAIEDDEKTPEQKMNIKRQILKSKFKCPILINWKRFDSYEAKIRSTRIGDIQGFNCDMVESNGYLKLSLSGLSKTSIDSDSMILTVSDIIIRAKQEGFIFKFEKINSSIKNNLITGKNSTNDKLIRVLGKRESLSSDGIIKAKLKENFNTNISGNIQQINLIDQYYVPTSSFGFALDPNAMSFKPNNEKVVDLKEFLKKEAFKKIQPEGQRKNLNETESEEEEEEEEENENENENESGVSNDIHNYDIFSSDFSESLSKSESKHSIEKEEKKEIKHNEIKQKPSQDKYYKVNVAKIKFCCYDYNKKMVVEIKNWDKRDTVEMMLNEDNNKREDNDSTVNSGEKSPKKNQNDMGTKEGEIKFAEFEEMSKENILIKQIEYKLGKEEVQPSIIHLRWTSFISFVALTGMTVAILVFILLMAKEIIENVIIIIKAYYLVILNSFGVYFTRELTLLNNTYYTKIPTKRELYINQMFNYTLNAFIESHDVITYILTSFLVLSKENADKIARTKLITRIIEDDFNVSKFNLSLNSALIEANAALFHVGHESIENIIPTNKDVYFYIFNSINDVANGLEILANIYVDELDINSNKALIKFIIIFCCFTIGLILLYFAISCAYNGVAKRKESYLEIFFEIGNNVIRASLEKCENFTKKMQSDTKSDTLSIVDDVELEKEKQTTEKKANRGENQRKKGNTSSKQTKLFKLKVTFLLIFMDFIFIIIFIFFWKFMSTLHLYITFFKNFIELENEYITLFNAVREYMLEPNNDIKEQNVIKYLNSKLENFYMIELNHSNYINENLHVMPKKYINTHLDIYLNSVCNDKVYIFDTVDDCQKFMSNATSLGFDVMMTYFLEEIRYMKRVTDKHNEEMNSYPSKENHFNYNTTIFGTDKFKQNWPDEKLDPKGYEYYKKHLRINTFNFGDIHLNLNIIIINFVSPNYEKLRITLSNCIEDTIKSEKFYSILLISIIIGLIVIGYVFVWIPFEGKMNQTIYRTKNMLNIIPKEVLASLKNIQKLLDLGQNLMKTQNIRQHESK